MRLGIAALTLIVSLGFVGLASAEESGNWFSRNIWPRSDKAEPDKKLDVKAEPAKAPDTAPPIDYCALKAKADLERRQDICIKLRGIAIASDPPDDDLLRKAEMLDQRAWEIFLASTRLTGAAVRPAVEPDAKKGDRK